MSDLDALLAGIVADPHSALRWLVMADWLDDHGFPERAELVRVHRELLRTCTDPDAHPDRPQLHARMMELMRAGVQPCIPEKTLFLPGGVALKMSFIPPGSFLMGSPETEEGRGEDETLHLVTLTRGFWLGLSPVTQAQWRAVMNTKPSRFKWDDYPVERVSWRDVQTFCADITAWTGLKVRLPTESEWEYAARSGSTTSFYWGDHLNGTQANCDGKYPYGKDISGPNLQTTTSVRSYALISPHPWDLVDVVGNVGEWCGDWYGTYSACELTDPFRTEKPESPSYRAYRGGSWNDAPRYCRIARRSGNLPSYRIGHVGFRIAADLE